MGAGRAAGADPVNPDWRGSRATRKNRRTQGLPSSRQEFVLWLQYGGWRVVVAAVALLLLLLVTILYISRARRSACRSSASQPRSRTSLLARVSRACRISPAPSAARSARPPPPPAALGAAKFRVYQIHDQGLFLRPDHNTDQPPLRR